MRIELSGSVKLANKKFVDHTMSNPRLLDNMTIVLIFLSKHIFVSEYFGTECCCKVSELDFSQSQFKKYRSGDGL